MSNTAELFHMLCEANTSIQDARDLLISTGHDASVVQSVINEEIASGRSMRWTNAAYPRNANLFFNY